VANLILAVLLFFCLSPQAFAEDRATVRVYLFWGEGCYHCTLEKEFLAKLAQKDQEIKIIPLEVTRSKQNLELLKQVGKSLGAEVSGVPFTVVGDRYFIGWLDEPTTGRAIEKAIQEIRAQPAPDVVARLLPAPPVPPPAPEKPAIPEKLPLPLGGEIEIKYLSLGLLTVIIGLLDGFNPCALWVLVFLINLLLGMEDRRKMWIFGGTFITASGIIYFLFMTAWLNLLLFLGFIFWIRVLIGLVALLAAFYNLREYFTNRAGVCKLEEGARRKRRMAQIKEAIQSRKFWLALGGIILLATAVNMVELICSAGFPVIYLQILSLNPLPFWQYYLYMALYIVMYMLDDMTIFVTAMITLQFFGVDTRYKRASHLIGGTLMLIIGVLLIFKPKLLMFG
jgi:hypothetical protein